MIVRKATIVDVDRLVEIRREFQLDVKGTQGGERFSRAVAEYLKGHLADDTAVVWIA